MRQYLRLPAIGVGLTVATLAGCSASQPGPDREGTAGAGGLDQSARGGETAGGGGAGAGAVVGGAGAAGLPGGSGGSPGADSGTDGAEAVDSRGGDPRPDAAGADAPPSSDGRVAANFTCSELVGLESTSEWFLAGFENLVVNARWQLRWHHRGYIEDWADPKNPYWGKYCDGEGCSRVSPCADGADSPDRVVFVALNWIYTTRAQWEADLRKDVDAIATRYPSVRNIELISSSRCPDRCTTIEPPGTMNELTAVQTCRTPAFVDEAIAAVAASQPGLVTVGPKFFTDGCDAFVSLHGPHLTTAGRKEIATKAGTHYAAHP